MEQSFLESSSEREPDSDQSGQNDSRLEKVLKELYERNRFGFYEAVVNKAEELMAKHPDYKDYLLFHLLIGSTVEGECANYDFPGEDSIKLFLETQQRTLPPKK